MQCKVIDTNDSNANMTNMRTASLNSESVPIANSKLTPSKKIRLDVSHSDSIRLTTGSPELKIDKFSMV